MRSHRLRTKGLALDYSIPNPVNCRRHFERGNHNNTSATAEKTFFHHDSEASRVHNAVAISKEVLDASFQGGRTIVRVTETHSEWTLKSLQGTRGSTKPAAQIHLGAELLLVRFQLVNLVIARPFLREHVLNQQLSAAPRKNKYVKPISLINVI